MKGLKRILLPAFTLIALTSCEGMGGGSGLFKHESHENDVITITNGGSSISYTDATFLKDGTKVSDEEVSGCCFSRHGNLAAQCGDGDVVYTI